MQTMSPKREHKGAGGRRGRSTGRRRCLWEHKPRQKAMPIWKCEATPYLHRTMPASKKSKERLKAIDEALALEDLVGSHPYEEAESMECIENIKVMIKLLGTNAKEDVTAMSVRNTEISKYLKNSVAPSWKKRLYLGYIV